MAKKPSEPLALSNFSPAQVRAISRLLRRAQDLKNTDSATSATYSYSFRSSVFVGEKEYLLTLDRLTWKNSHSGSVAYQEIAKVKTYQTRFWGSSKSYWTCILYSSSGKKIYLSAAHRLSARNIEDRSSAYIPFIKELEARIAAANSNAQFVGVRGFLSRLDAAGGWFLVKALRIMGRFDCNRSAATVARISRVLGPRLRGHRIACAQLSIAFPELDSTRVKKILDGMWDNIGRIIAEYGHLEKLWDFDPTRPRLAKRILLDDATAERCRRLTAESRPALVFGAHLANWELLPLAAAAYGRDIAIVYREPKNKSFAAELAKRRGKGVADLIPAGPHAPLKIRHAFRRNCLVGMLVDQFDAKGIEVIFFGRACRVSSLLGRVARLFDCPIYGGRVVRLPGGKYHFELTDPLTPPRDSQGKVDVAATTQMVTSIIEGWVREHPNQWMWIHRRWR